MLEYALYLGGRIGALALGALGVHAVAATTDRVSLGHATFVGVAAYGTALALEGGAPWPLAAGLGVAAAVLAGALVGGLTARLTGPAFALATLAVLVIAEQGAAAQSGLGGHGGLPVPGGGASNPVVPALGSLAAVGVVSAALARWPRTPWGHSLALVRAHPDAAAVQGIAVGRQRALTFALSAGVAGLAGPVFVGLGDALFPSQFGWTTSLELLLAALLGGRLGPWGVVGASALLVGLEVALGPASEWQAVLHGLALLGALLAIPRRPA